MSAETSLQARILDLLAAVEGGEVSASAAFERLGSLPYDDLGFARVDTHRELRQGAPEAVLAEGKTPEEIEAIVRSLLDGGAGSVLVTRADADARAAVRARRARSRGARARAAGLGGALAAGRVRPRDDRLGRHVGHAPWCTRRACAPSCSGRA